MFKKWMIIGGTGLLGSTLVCRLKKEDVSITALTCSRSLEIDGVEWVHQDLLADFSCEHLIDQHQPDIIVYATGFTNVDGCEQDISKAMQLNSIVPAEFAKQAALKNIPYVYISSDALFDGSSPFVDESTSPNPINVYGYSKLYGEQLVQHFCSNALIFRTNFYGKGLPWRGSLTDWLWSQFLESKPFNAFSDCYFTPIDLNSLAEYIIETANLHVSGVYNLVGTERLSKYDFAVRFAEHFGFDAQLAQKSSIREAPLKAKRTLDMSLDVAKLSRLLNKSLPNIEQGFKNIAPFYSECDLKTGVFK